MGILCIHKNTFFTHQKNYIHKVVRKYWNQESDKLVTQLKAQGGVTLAGDARCDSMGHCAKYGSYSTMAVELKKILCVKLIQVGDATQQCC